MSLAFYSYISLGSIVLMLAFALFFFKRKMMDVQWLFVCVMLMYGIAKILHGCLYNAPLSNNHTIILLYLLFSFFIPPTVHVITSTLTNPRGVPLRTRTLFLVSLGAFVIILGSLFFLGKSASERWLFYSLCLFNAVMVIEMVYVVVVAHRRVRDFREYISEMFMRGQRRTRYLRRLIRWLSMLMIIEGTMLVVYPFVHSVPEVILLCYTVMMFFLLTMVFVNLRHLTFGAENIQGDSAFRQRINPRVNPRVFARNLTQYVEQQQAFLQPDISAYTLAKHFSVSVDDIVDVIHDITGSSFNDYIDSLRIEYAVSVVMNPLLDDDEATVVGIAARCGYTNHRAFLHAFERIMQKTFAQYLGRE